MPDVFALGVPQADGRIPITTTASMPPILFGGTSGQAPLYVRALNHLWNVSPTFRGLMGQHQTHGGSLKLSVWSATTATATMTARLLSDSSEKGDTHSFPLGSGSL